MRLEAGLLAKNTNNGVGPGSPRNTDNGAGFRRAQKLFFVVVAGEWLVARSFHYSY